MIHQSSAYIPHQSFLLLNKKLVGRKIFHRLFKRSKVTTEMSDKGKAKSISLGCSKSQIVYVLLSG